jgi:uroporphyrinogen-III decarboxylase
MGLKMNIREKIISIINGDSPEGLLFVPRLDIWYNRNTENGTLPLGYENLTLMETTKKLRVGFHSIIPDFIRTGNIEDIYHRGLGFYNNPDFPFKIDFSDICFETEITEKTLKTTYHASSGKITTLIKYDREIFKSGVSIPDILEHPIKTLDDYRPLSEIMSKIKILPNHDGYRKYRDRIGESGVAVAYTSLAAGPMQHIMRDLRKFESFCLDMYDCPEKMNELCEPLSEIYKQIIKNAAESCAEVILFGANYDDTITYKPFLDRHIAPWINIAAKAFHEKSKYLLTHTDGENKGLIESLNNCNFDVADSICPSPMTKLAFNDYRRVFTGKKTIWGGVPSVLLLKNSCGEDDFRNYIKKLINDCKPYDRLILSISDTTPPDAEFDRILYIRDECEKTFN